MASLRLTLLGPKAFASLEDGNELCVQLQGCLEQQLSAKCEYFTDDINPLQPRNLEKKFSPGKNDFVVLLVTKSSLLDFGVLFRTLDKTLSSDWLERFLVVQLGDLDLSQSGISPESLRHQPLSFREDTSPHRTEDWQKLKKLLCGEIALHKTFSGFRQLFRLSLFN